MALIGNTIRITAEFVTWAGSKADAEKPKLTVYQGLTPIETIELTEENHIGVGRYQVDYIIPEGRSALVFELKGLVEGMPEIARIEEKRIWVK